MNRGRFIYETDALARVVRATGKIDQLITAARNTYQQRIAGGKFRLPTDDGGHLFATMFGGPGEA
ncbi:DNA/RNA non-specific endonuclease, partial [Gordonia sp. (in: high G+C Gram-positive bacteria)]|uniref:DNA/RNA non-specific endonuclease n=1 Tax=Gordonia sp. (in: high G+C Gram-positive bacteria) TaxID=84139 RepID=UPI003C768B3C